MARSLRFGPDGSGRHDEFVQRDPRHLAADGVEAADDDGFRGVVDDQVDPGRLLQGADVAPLLADDAPLELVGRQRQHRDRDLGGLVGGDALDRLGDDLAGPALAFVAGGKLRFADLARDLVAQLLLDLRHQDPWASWRVMLATRWSSFSCWR